MEKNAGIKRNPYLQACFSGLGGVALLLVCLLLCALCTLHIPAAQGKEALLGRAALLLVSFLAIRRAVAGQREHALPAAGICGGVLLAFLLVLALASEHAPVFSTALLFNLLCILAGGFCALAIGKRRQGKRRRRR